MAGEARVALFLLAGACSHQRMPEARPIVGGGNEAEISSVLEQALEADSKSQPADSLYSPHAVVIVEGRERRLPPRFAGIGPGGEVAITSTQLEMRATAAWGDVEYRWESGRSNRAAAGRATFVLTPAQGRRGWWIVQAHSSVAR
jgi:hypothetical protein